MRRLFVGSICGTATEASQSVSGGVLSQPVTMDARDVDVSPRRAVLFDFGDTLVHFGDVDRRALFEQAAWRTYKMWARRQRRMPGWQRYYLHQTFSLRWGFFKTMVLRRELDAIRYMRRACRKLWLHAPQEFFEELAWQWYKPLAEIAEVDPLLPEVLDDLRARGYELAVVSNTFVPGLVMDRHLRALSLIDRFPVRVYSSDVGYRKPDRRIFDLALEKLEIPAEKATFVGDLPATDIEGARRAGISAVWMNRDGEAKAEASGAGPEIHRITELPAMLEKLYAGAPGAAAEPSS